MKIKEKINLIKNKEISSKSLVENYISQIGDDKYNAFITKTFDFALEKAKFLDNLSKEKISTLKLPGIIFGLKDSFCTNDIKTTCGSKMLENFIPPYDAEVFSRLNNQGSIMIGKNNMDEFSMGSSGKTSYFGAAINPLKNKNNPNLLLSPGGSSSGGAVSVAANLCDFAIGGDTGGSIKQPAAMCGIVGFRPTYGTVSRYGLIPLSSSIDQPGVMTKNIEDAAYIMEIISGKDNKDESMSNNSSLKILDKFDKIQNLNGIKIAFANVSEFNVLPSIKQALKDCAILIEKIGGKVDEIEIPLSKDAVSLYYGIVSTEASSNLAKFDGIRYGYRTKEEVKNIDDLYIKTRNEGFGNEVKRRIILGSVASSMEEGEIFTDYQKCMILVEKIKLQFEKIFEKYDAIIAPVSPTLAFGINENLSTYDLWMADIFTCPYNIAGLGGLSFPFSKDEETSLPINLQIISKPFNDEMMFCIGKFLENAKI
jgi:aspartyl-tRNA(Asn)/glutamyl-tRNA(Gln) amidotransferase subunit A